MCKRYLNLAGPDESNAEGLLELSNQQLLDTAAGLDAYSMDAYTGRCTFCPVVDGTFLKEFPTLADFSTMEKPVLVGSNMSEGNFQSVYLWTDPVRFTPALLRRLSSAQQEALLATYPEMIDKKAFGELLTDVMYAFPKIRFAEHLSRGKSEVYVYRFDYYTPIMKKLGLDACHVAEMIPLFELKEAPFRQLYIGSEIPVHKVGQRMRTYWGAFARTGSPNAEGLKEWRPYTENERNTMVINNEDKLIPDAEVIVRKRYEGYERVLI